eukprot:gnl/TRDRNA2_/TRDRNA2_81024_c1_seq1.p1 gnl/TRDRNA2_/TRDRNA2_81024_c1~~gnl/TRDRNA2_/TRDRNA2_81024_c1_seq1.p1  ORF type:complete len:361 (+),score=121.91 gnl/TRDRNA2_/TRDRNA2_81024_c1_seq1:31-1083(+)
MCHEVGDKAGEGAALGAVSDIFMQTGEFVVALRIQKQRAALLREVGDKEAEAMNMLHIAQICLNDGELREAVKASQEAQVLGQVIKSPSLEIQGMLLTTQAYVAQMSEGQKSGGKEYDKALRNSKEALTMSADLDDKELMGSSNYWVAHVLMMKQKSEEALTFVNEAINVFHEMGTGQSAKAGEANALLLAGQIEQIQGDNAKALDLFKQGKGLFKDIGDKQGESVADGLISDAQTAVPVAAAAPTAAQMAAFSAAALPGAASAVAEVSKGLDPAYVRQTVIELVKNVSGAGEAIDGDTPLMDFGVDSLSSVQLRSEMARTFNMKLPNTLMFDMPSVGRLTEFLVEASQD